MHVLHTKGHVGCHVLQAKGGWDHPDFYQHKVCVRAYGKGGLHICDSTIKSVWYIQVLEKHALQLGRSLFQGQSSFQQDSANPH